jgi:hypothetical protein
MFNIKDTLFNFLTSTLEILVNMTHKHITISFFFFDTTINPKFSNYLTSKAWSSGKKTGLESERSRVRIPLVSLEGSKCNYLCK